MTTLQRNTSIEVPAGYHIEQSLAGARMNAGDPTFQLGRTEFRHALETPVGAVSVTAIREGSTLSISSFGPAAEWMDERWPAFLGLEDSRDGFDPGPLRRLSDRFRGLYLTRQPVLFHRLVAIVLQQLIRYRDACRLWRTITRRFGGDAPGDLGLRMFPPADVINDLGDYDLIACGVNPKQARIVLRIASQAERIERLGRDDRAKLRPFLRGLPGIGPWTTELFMGSVVGDADAVPTGDLHFPRVVAEYLGERDPATDETMLAQLEPFRGHRFRVLSMIIQDARRHGRIA